LIETQQSPLLRYVLIGAGVAVIAAALKASASTANLILVSALLAATLYPMPVALTKRGMKRGPAIALTAILAVAGGVLLILVLAKSLNGLSENVPAYKASMATQMDALSERLAARGISLDQALKPDPERFMNAVGRLARAGLSSLGYGLFALVLIVLFLIEFPLFASADSGPGTLRYRLDEAMRLVRRFVWAQRHDRRRHRVHRPRPDAGHGDRCRRPLGGDLLPLCVRAVRVHSLCDSPGHRHAARARRGPRGPALRPLLHGELHRRQCHQAEVHGAPASASHRW
jgi:hypothetical protein